MGRSGLKARMNNTEKSPEKKKQSEGHTHADGTVHAHPHNYPQLTQEHLTEDQKKKGNQNSTVDNFFRANEVASQHTDNKSEITNNKSIIKDVYSDKQSKF